VGDWQYRRGIHGRLDRSVNGEADAAKRLRMISEAESMLLDAMPIVPIYLLARVGLQKPFVEGCYDNPLDEHPLRFVSIDATWRDAEPGEPLVSPGLLGPKTD
jgi:hypothetical protein